MFYIHFKYAKYLVSTSIYSFCQKKNVPLALETPHFSPNSTPSPSTLTAILTDTLLHSDRLACIGRRPTTSFILRIHPKLIQLITLQIPHRMRRSLDAFARHLPLERAFDSILDDVIKYGRTAILFWRFP